MPMRPSFALAVALALALALAAVPARAADDGHEIGITLEHNGVTAGLGLLTRTWSWGTSQGLELRLRGGVLGDPARSLELGCAVQREPGSLRARLDCGAGDRRLRLELGPRRPSPYL
ncbi:MAG TPA: hypothetical protein VFX28_04900 [Methylomirabilota bacterium]|nr:hypothetical protein [Methylomirabilota bacterium]